MEKIFDLIGGRKFIMSLVLIAVGTLVELKTERGVSTAFAGLLVGILGTFSAANAFVTKSMGHESGEPTPTVPDSGPAQEEIKKIVSDLSDKVDRAATLTATVGTSVANQNKILAAMMQK